MRLSRQDEQAVKAVVNELRFTQPWIYYSTLRLNNFQAAIPSQVLAFWQTTEGASGLPVTNLAQVGQIPDAFLVHEIALRVTISVYDDPRIFELLTNYTAIKIMVGSDEMITGPTTQFPAGGGVSGMVEADSGSAPVPITGPGGGASATSRSKNAAVAGDATQAEGTDMRGFPLPTAPSTSTVCSPVLASLPYRPALNVLSNGVAHRTNVFSLGRDPIDVKKGSNIKTEFHIDQAALNEIRGLRPPMAPGVTIQLRLIGKRARAAGYGMGG
jgi:hypothetical protein